MRLYELRNKLNMTQKDCAKVLNISLRSYIDYENNIDKANSKKYLSYCSQLQNYLMIKSGAKNFKTNVLTGEELEKSVDLIKSFKKRDCFGKLMDYLKDDNFGKVCILYGIRRTGKTTLLLQTINELKFDSTAYLKMNSNYSMADLSADLDILNKSGYKYVFVDEVTLLKDFIDTAAILSDIYGQMGMKIVLSGTDSLAFAMAGREELYDRKIMIHTTFIPFNEYSRLLGIGSVDTYIEYGGTLCKENVLKDGNELKEKDFIFQNAVSCKEYMDSAICKNIQHTLENDHSGEYLNQLRDMYYEGELTNVINRIIERMNHGFVYQLLNEKFKSHDLGSAKNLLLHEGQTERGTILNRINEQELLERLKTLIDVKEKEDLKIPIQKEHVDKVKVYLIMLDLIKNIPVKIENGSDMDYYIFVQPGMRYSIAKALIESLKEDVTFKKMFGEDQNYVIEKILSDVKGKMLEDIVLLETNYYLEDNKKAFKYKFSEGGEFDMVIDNDDYTCELFEIKHSNKINKMQAKNLQDSNKCKSISEIYGKIIKKCILYRGKDTIINGIEYKNVEKFLLEINKQESNK